VKFHFTVTKEKYLSCDACDKMWHVEIPEGSDQEDLKDLLRLHVWISHPVK
jgi:hypothetical protein